MFDKVLIANRGEIAIRVIRACRELGISTVAVYSEADRAALHVQLADQAVCIGPPASTESYLRMDRILDAAKRTGAGAIHPGYGFLSENARFAQACVDSGLVFIGPTPNAISQMGSKLMARQIMENAGVPVVPGTLEPVHDEQEALRISREIGYPVMLKASAGGGGKGMRLVDNEEDLLSALRAARSESARAFGDDAVYIEKCVSQPRHVEIQVFGDVFGNTVHLHERDCSIQRRHQKVVEETPCPVLRPEVREKMTAVAIRAAKAVGYVGAGTVEMLMDGDQNFYFLEMNTRLQVEHPITEMVTGIDLVRAQLQVAAGQPLPFRQEDIRATGAAVECRIYAEDPSNGFTPSPGSITELREPGGPWVRVDGTASLGWEVPVHYDSLIAKLLTWGRNRTEAIERMSRALEEYTVRPIKTTIPFHRQVMRHPQFLSGQYTTGFIAQHAAELTPVPGERDVEAALLACALQEKLAAPAQEGSSPVSPWRMFGRQASHHRL